jgi:hypothetical protein
MAAGLCRSSSCASKRDAVCCVLQTYSYTTYGVLRTITTVLLQDVFPPPSPLGAAADAACPLRQRARSEFLRTVNELGQVSHLITQ